MKHLSLLELSMGRCQGSQKMTKSFKSPFLMVNLKEEVRPCGPGTDHKKALNPEKTKKFEKKKKKYKIPLPGLGPENTKKLPKKCKNGPTSPFLHFFGHFFVFSRPNPGRGILYFLAFFVFAGLRGFCDLCQARRVAKEEV